MAAWVQWTGLRGTGYRNRTAGCDFVDVRAPSWQDTPLRPPTHPPTHPLPSRFCDYQIQRSGGAALPAADLLALGSGDMGGEAAGRSLLAGKIAELQARLGRFAMGRSRTASGGLA